MKSIIYCRPTSHGWHSFYAKVNGQDFYLFGQKYYYAVNSYFRDGVTINAALDPTRAKRDNAVLRTMDKLPMYIKYAEKYYGIKILKSTIKKNEQIRSA